MRAGGWASALGELEEGLQGVAAPVLDAEGRCHGALGVSGPSYRGSADAVARLAEECALAAREIGARLSAAGNRV